MNPNTCAHTPGTPDPKEASCAENTYIQDADIIDSRGASGDNRGNGSVNTDGPADENDRVNGNGRGNGRGN